MAVKSRSLDNQFVIGVDPGINITGYAVLRVMDGRVFLEDLGCIKVPRKNDFAWRLNYLYEASSDLFSQYRGALVVFEEIYSNLRYPYTSVLMGHARSVLFLAAHRSGCLIKTISPARVKKAITGRGNASKEQVRGVLGQVYQLRIEGSGYPLDVSDALAIGTAYVWRAGRDWMEG